MGELTVEKLSSASDKANYIHQLVKDIEALEIMIEKGMIEKSPIRIGAEQEFCLVDNDFFPQDNSLDVLSAINDKHFTTEIGNYNLEINLDPLELKNDCFSVMHKQLESFLSKAKKAASENGAKIILTGILPTLALKHISVENMTPMQRYDVLNEAIKESRKQDFDIHIKGVDELNLRHDSVMLEGCNTSFQMHLQINPDNFVEDYNWAQAISGPILSACTNSPLLFGKELWSETRIALFTQSVDTRANSFLLNEKQSRVSFGGEWATGSVSDIFKDNVSRFRSLLTSQFEKDSVEMINNGEIPKLKALNLHNGTVYRWNRTCYGVGGGKPHLRIENRYIPSGPTVSDEIANFMFWVGVMVGRPKKYGRIHEKMDFKDAKSNFFSAARYGMSTQFKWNGSYVPASKLILDELLPMAFRGLYSLGILPKDAEHYLTIIENRIRSHNGSEWMVKSYRHLLQTQRPFEALQNLTAFLYEKQEKDYPVCTWSSNLGSELELFKDKLLVKHIMNSGIFSVDEKDSLELVVKMMKWKDIHHMPVINGDRKLVGLLTWTDVQSFDPEVQKNYSVKSMMVKDLITVSQYESIENAKQLMEEKKINCLPVVKEDRLIGIVTATDLDAKW
ncbi:MAG: CBS domain-containing protein [Deltaproteobacteria bacterium]|nr:CBS domain-containing protein [Bacteroidia bacterium]MBT8349660.1 CBS domain-containing protein [Deltaproteobacteria bacterium]NND10382.1 CBS domain-containing protein [Flavobacteriaceae bacterium]MBT8308979.1 CBS domain-containing protein [Bacteroidia bacterium]NNK27934.1 CBS domain-containing protein [Flavobacteriaceae bacterium]